jgi:hypothetical protein
VGEDISAANWHFQANKNTFASFGQKLIYHGPLKPLETFLLRTVLAPWSYIASVIFHDYLWHPFIGRERTRCILRTSWGKLFNSY